MNKSEHNYVNNVIPYEELNNFIEPLKTNIEIPMVDMRNFNSRFNNHSSISRMQFCIELQERDLLDDTGLYKYMTTGELIGSITYNTHIDGYDFRINPINIFNDIFKRLGHDIDIPFIDLDKKENIFYLKKIICDHINFIKSSITDPETRKIINLIYENVDKIIDLYNVDINGYIKDNCEPKDVLFYLAYNSLCKYEETKNSIFTVFPYEYYHYVSHMKTSQYPHKIITSSGEIIWFNEFREKYRDIIGEDYVPNTFDKTLDNEDILLPWEIIKPGKVYMDEDDEYEEGSIAITEEADEEKKERLKAIKNHCLKLYKQKLKFYRNSPYIGRVEGISGLKGYIGLIYENDYFVFDKYYTKNKKGKKSIMVPPNAIYILPADRIELIGCDKQRIMLEQKNDPRIIRMNHDENGKYIKRLEEIISAPSVSTMSYKDAIDLASRKSLHNKKTILE